MFAPPYSSPIEREELEGKSKGREVRPSRRDAPRDIDTLGEVVEEVIDPEADTQPTAPQRRDGEAGEDEGLMYDRSIIIRICTILSRSDAARST